MAYVYHRVLRVLVINHCRTCTLQEIVSTDSEDIISTKFSSSMKPHGFNFPLPHGPGQDWPEMKFACSYYYLLLLATLYYVPNSFIWHYNLLLPQIPSHVHTALLPQNGVTTSRSPDTQGLLSAWVRCCNITDYCPFLRSNRLTLQASRASLLIYCPSVYLVSCMRNMRRNVALALWQYNRALLLVLEDARRYQSLHRLKILAHSMPFCDLQPLLMPVG